MSTTTEGRELADLSLEELANIQVTSVSKKAESLADAPASIYVITEEDIRRSGALTLPATLRLAPNLQVAQVDQANYAISARGFNSRFSNKLLVLMDGRTVYSPLFSGVYWDTQDVMLEDLDRIEVISGPGATLWGANAVNGVINITSRSAADTQGALISVAGGSDRKQAALRYGGKLSSSGHYRVYAKGSDFDPATVGDEGWDHNKAGFRTDWNEKDEHGTLQGDIYRGTLGGGGDGIDISGGNILGRVSKTLAGGSQVTLQGYLDHAKRDWPGVLRQQLDTLDLEFQHAVAFSERHEIVWGGGYRHTSSDVVGYDLLTLESSQSALDWANLFVQDKLPLAQDLALTFGFKAERNPYTGWESLPSLRLAWTPTRSQLVWAAISRAVRSPSQLEREVLVPAEPSTVDGEPQYILTGNDNYSAEVAHVAELGYRSQPHHSINWSITGFYSEYDDLRTLERGQDSGLEFRNTGHGYVYGIETWGSWRVSEKLILQGGVVSQRVDLDDQVETADLSGRTWLAFDDPDYYGILRASWDIAEHWELESIFRHTAELSRFEIPAYTTVDVRLGWAPVEQLELALVAQNVLDHDHAEFEAPETNLEVSRAVHWKVLWEI